MIYIYILSSDKIDVEMYDLGERPISTDYWQFQR